MDFLWVNARIRDAAHPEEMLPPGDKVLCDVPCSGLGIILQKAGDSL